MRKKTLTKNTLNNWRVIKESILHKAVARQIESIAHTGARFLNSFFGLLAWCHDQDFVNVESLMKGYQDLEFKEQEEKLKKVKHMVSQIEMKVPQIQVLKEMMPKRTRKNSIAETKKKNPTRGKQ